MSGPAWHGQRAHGREGASRRRDGGAQSTCPTAAPPSSFAYTHSPLLSVVEAMPPGSTGCFTVMRQPEDGGFWICSSTHARADSGVSSPAESARRAQPRGMPSSPQPSR